mgnify:CR=1 FL=1
MEPTVREPRARGWRAFVGAVVLRLCSWRVVGVLPNAKKYILIVAPHTTNMDFVIGLSAIWKLRLRVKLLLKHTLFAGPLGWWFRRIGGIPVNRQSKHNLVDQIATAFDQEEHFILALAPEGSRAHSKHWRSGFFHIALAAKVPVVCVGFDCFRRRVSIGDPVYPTGNAKVDMDSIRMVFEAWEIGPHPRFGPIRLRDEVPKSEMA